jgi:hypothetical protein
MKAVGPHTRAVLLFVLLGGCLLGPDLAAAADKLDWRKAENRVDAEIAGWPLPRFLETLAEVTGWQVYVEPNTRHTVSAKFRDRTAGEALRLLLGDLSFAVLPQTNGPSRLFVFRTSLGEATQLVRPPEKPAPARTAKPIPNELIVTLKPGAKIDDLARKLGAKVIGRADGLNAYRLSFDDDESAAAARDSLRSNPDVEGVDYNYVMFPDPVPEPLSFSSVPPLNLRPKAGGDGRVVIGLIDTPVHTQGSGYDDFFLAPLGVAGDGKASGKELTHGDSMAQTLLRGISLMLEGKDGTGARILPVDVYGSSPSTTTFDVAYGIYAAINSGATIINLSLGSDGDTDFLHKVVKNGREQGVLFFAAAGNEPTTIPTYPAAYPEVIAVTAGNSRGEVAPFANRGDFVDVVAPGSTVVTFQGQSFLVGGTSASTAYAAGAAAGLADGSGRKLSEVEAAIRKILAVKAK